MFINLRINLALSKPGRYKYCWDAWAHACPVKRVGDAACLGVWVYDAAQRWY